MRSFATYAVLSSAVGLAAAGAVQRRWDYPESFKLEARQEEPEPGSPRYACHENCGLAITLGREEENHCTHDEWNQRYNSCLECANTFGIWTFYGRSIAVYATECGLTPEPSASGWEAPAPVTTTSQAPAPVVTTTPAPPAQVTTTPIGVEEPASETPGPATTTTEGGAAPVPEESSPAESDVESPAESDVESPVQSGYPVPEQSTTLSQVPSAAPSASQTQGNTTAPAEPTHAEAGAGSVAASFAMVGAAAVLALAL